VSDLEDMVRRLAAGSFNAKIEVTQTKVVALRFREALAELVALKDLKDAHGNTPEYLERQPKAWDTARKRLEHTPVEALTPYRDYLIATERLAEAALRYWMPPSGSNVAEKTKQMEENARAFEGAVRAYAAAKRAVEERGMG
jgi:hypothetical protein